MTGYIYTCTLPENLARHKKHDNFSVIMHVPTSSGMVLIWEELKVLTPT